MITSAEVTQAIQGAWRLARFDPTGLAFFERTIEGFWRSFWVAVILAPAYLLISTLGYERAEVVAGPARFYAIEAIGYVISWFAFPLAMFYLTALMDRAEAFIGYIVAYNWSHILQMAVFLPIAVMAPADPIEAPTGWSLVTTLATVAIFIYVGYIAKTALDISRMMAAGIVALDLAISVIVTSAKDMMLFSGSAAP